MRPRKSVLPMILDSMLWYKPSSIVGTICLIRILFFILLTHWSVWMHRRISILGMQHKHIFTAIQEAKLQMPSAEWWLPWILWIYKWLVLKSSRTSMLEIPILEQSMKIYSKIYWPSTPNSGSIMGIFSMVIDYVYQTLWMRYHSFRGILRGLFCTFIFVKFPKDYASVPFSFFFLDK